MACALASRPRMSAALLAAARRWASRRVVVLSSAGEEPTDEYRKLFSHYEGLGLRVDVVDWETGNCEDASVVLPLLAWSYSASVEHTSRYCDLVRELIRKRAAPTSDLRVNLWTVHKRYLIALASSGVPTVPTVLLDALSSDAELREAWRALRKCVGTGADAGARQRCECPTLT